MILFWLSLGEDELEQNCHKLSLSKNLKVKYLNENKYQNSLYDYRLVKLEQVKSIKG